MTLNKEELKVMIMLNATNIDGNMPFEEVKVKLEKTGFETVEKMENLFSKMNNAEVLECIREDKAHYAPYEDDSFDLIHDFCLITEVEEKSMAVEDGAVRTMLN